MSDQSHHGEIGDLIEIERKHLGESRRTGEILEVLGPPGNEHYRVRWEDGHETLFYPSGHSSIVHRAPRFGRQVDDLTGGAFVTAVPRARR